MGLLSQGYSFKEGRTLNPLHNRKVRNDKEKENRKDAQGKSIDMLADATAIADRDRAEFEALQKKQIEDANALKKRSTSQQGGGRAGLMYGGNSQGVA